MLPPRTNSIQSSDAINLNLSSRSSLLNKGRQLNVTMQPIFRSYKNSRCQLKSDDGKLLASMRTNTSGYRDLARACAVPVSTIIVSNLISASVAPSGLIAYMSNDIIKNLGKQPETIYTQKQQENFERLKKKFEKKIVPILIMSVGVSFMVNFTLFIRKPVYEFLDSNNNVQLTARHQSDRKSILIEYTKRKGSELMNQCYLMKLNEVTNKWDLYTSNEDRENDKVILNVPTTWHRNTKFDAPVQGFTFNVASMTRYSFRIGNNRVIAPLTSGTERFEMQFNGNSEVPWDVLAFCCYIVRTIDTMPLDFLFYITFLMVVLFAIEQGRKKLLKNMQASQDEELK